MGSVSSRVHRFYLYQACSSFAIWTPFWALWIRSHLATDFEFTLADVAFWVGLLLFQLPVGVLADRMGRRRTIVLSEALRSAGILGYGLGTSFWGYVTANAVWSLGAAFSIGTSAYLYETLLAERSESEFPRIIGRNTMVQLLSNAAGAIVGGVFVSITGNLQDTMLVGAAVNLVAVATAWTFREPEVERHPEATYVRQLVQGVRIVRRREGVALLIGVEVSLGVSVYIMTLFRPLYFEVLGYLPAQIGFWISGFLLMAAVVSFFAGDVSNRIGEFATLSLLAALAAVPFLGMWLAGRQAWAVLLQAPVYIVWSLQSPLVSAFLNRRLEPSQRATVLSMGSFAYTLGLVIVEPLAGLTTTATNLLDLGLFLGILATAPCAYILVRWRQTVAPWPAITPVPSRLVAGEARASRFLRVFERLGRLWP